MRRLFLYVVMIVFAGLLWVGTLPPAFAANTTLIPCKESPMFQKRQQQAPEGYYYTRPFEVYSSELLCGTDGLPHLPLDRLDRTIDVAIPFAIFFYVAGFIGWSGRSYLQKTNRSSTPEQLEIFIDLPLAIQSIIQGAMWPLLVLKEFLSGELTAKDNEIPVSPR